MPAKSELNPRQQRFVEEYLVDLNATQAAIRAGYSPRTAGSQAHDLLKKPEIQLAIGKSQRRTAQKIEITKELVLEQLYRIVTANPNNLIQHRRVNCRFCHGVGHEYQWRDEAEWHKAIVAAQQAAEKEGIEDPALPDNNGGYGFNPTREPHAGCPRCFGEGHGDVHVTDTRHLDPATAALYAGVKVTRDGIEVKMHDKMAALDKLGKHLGLWSDKIKLGVDPDDPLATLLQNVQGIALKPVDKPQRGSE